MDPLGYMATSVYDAAGQSVASVDALGRRTTTVYDAAGRSVAAPQGHHTTAPMAAAAPLASASSRHPAASLNARPSPAGRAYGKATRNPTSLPHNYTANLAIVLGVVWAVAAVAVVVRMRTSRRRPVT